ncbi:ROK family protein [Actinomyces sp. B33]|uniref:ROK family protein n=1 Tax=Actinomyces sp. B33 TaxID=2942131 RepID=UPI002341C1AC|nr:ROK family protein [Actinomyces sp. B33]MDC4233574.1 ROK family protein [Actinomyces sp. B33]
MNGAAHGSGRPRLLALDIGGTKIGWSLMDGREPCAEPGASGRIATLADEGGAAVAERIRSLVADVVGRLGPVSGVAAASAGVVDPRTGAIVSATNTMPGWGGTPLGDILREASGAPVRVLNDVHAHGLGEALAGAGRDHDTVLSVAVGTGIGGALVDRGRVLTGGHHVAGHVGHIHHHAGARMACSCGRSGHIEAFCSGSGIAAWYEARRADGDPRADDARALQALADGGHPLARACFVESARALGECLGSLANCVDPSIIIISGSMTRSGAAWWDGLREGYAASAMTPVAPTPLVVGSLGDDAPLIGAAANFENTADRNAGGAPAGTEE